MYLPLLGFTKLKEKLRDGSKTQTIRKPRKIPIKISDTLHIYWQLRTKSCTKIGDANVTKIERKRFKDITEEDAIRDGFLNLKDFQIAFQKIHADILYINSLGLIQERYPYDGFDVITFQWTYKNPTFFC